MVDADDWDGVQRGTHTLRGICATLGATRLLDRVTSLETALKIRNGTDEAYWLDSTQTEMDELLAALGAQLAPDDVDEIAGPTMAAIGVDVHAPGGADATSDLSWLRDLRDLLAQGDNEARAVWASHKAKLTGTLDSQTVKDVSNAMENFDFDQALQLLERVAAG
jgi:HPt (histidine-containing phosphotransfer) domain-containing protein